MGKEFLAAKSDVTKADILLCANIIKKNSHFTFSCVQIPNADWKLNSDLHIAGVLTSFVM